MTSDQMTELLDLYLADELPEALRAHVEDYLASHPAAAQDAGTLRETVRPAARPSRRAGERLVHRAHAGQPAA